MNVFKKLSMCLLSGMLCFGLGATTQAATKVGNGVYEMSTWADEGAETDTLTSVDITGDGKTDKIETVTTSDEIELKVNAFKLPLSYSGKKFTLKSTAVSAGVGIIPSDSEDFTRTFTAAQKIQTYKSAGSSKKAFVIKKNSKFAVKKLAIVKKNIYVQVKAGSKTGWIKLNTSNKISVAG